VAAVFLLLATNAGLIFYGMAIYLEAITSEEDLSTTAVSLATSMVFLISGIVGRFIAPFIERHDLRYTVALGGLASTASLALLGTIDSLTSLFGVYLLMSFGFAMAGLVPATTLITRWFHARRSVALSIASTGLSVGGLTFARMASELVDENGLDAAAPTIAIVYLMATGVSLLAMWPDPSAHGHEPDGAAPTAADAPPVSGVDYERAIHTRFFAVVCVGFVLSMSSQVGGISHLANLGAERADRAAGASAIAAVALASVVFRLLGGVLASRMPMMLMVSILSALQAVSMVGLAYANSTTTLIAWSLLFGATIGNLLMLQPLIIADAFGVASYPRIFALQQMIVTGGIALGPFVLGSLRDAANYRVAYIAAAVLSLGGAVVLSQSGTWRPSPETVTG
jgi:MFS family permease